MVRPDRKFDRAIALTAAPDLSLASVDALELCFALKNGDRVEVLRWETGFQTSSRPDPWRWGRHGSVQCEEEEEEEEEDASESVDEASIFG